MTKMFLGEYQPNMTEGGRIALPSRLRDQFTGNTVILARGFEPCVFVFDVEDWQAEAGRLVDKPITDPETRQLRRYLFGNATEANIDDQGRVVIPPNLREFANLNGKTAVIGAGNHVEIWDKAAWEAHLAKVQAQITAGTE